MEGLHQKYLDSVLQTRWHNTELLDLNPDCAKSALLVANFFGDEVFASLTLLLCLEVCESFKFRILAIPVMSKEKRNEIDPTLRQELLMLPQTRKIDLFVVFSQGHPYLDGFYLERPWGAKRCMKTKKIISQVAEQGHEVGAFSDKFDKPTYSVLEAEPTDLISQMNEKGIEAYRFVVSQDIWAGYRAALVLLT